MDSYNNCVLTWRMFMTSSISAAIHLGQDFLENLQVYKNTKFENIENVFNITQRFMKLQSEEILNVKTLDYHSPSWTRSTLFNDNVIKWAKAKVCVYAASVLCVGPTEQAPGAADAKWTGQIEDLKRYSSNQDAFGLDGEAIEFEWKISQGLQHWLFSRISRWTWRGRTWSQRTSKIGSSLCSCSTTSSGKRMMRIASRMPRKSRITQKGFYQDIGLFWVQVRDRDGEVTRMMDNRTVQPTKWYSNSKKMVILFSHPPARWVAECWNKGKAKVPFTLWTQNCYLKQFILWIKSVFTRLFRIGLTNLLWKRRKITHSCTRG